MATDEQGVIVYLNERAATLLGGTPSALEGYALSSISPALGAMLTANDRGELSLPAKKADDEPRIFGYSTRLLPLAQGLRATRVISFADISEQRRRERLEAHRRRLEDLGKIIATIAHEIRNPVFAIGALAQVLMDEPTVDGEAEVSNMVERILAETRRITRLIDDLLTFGREAPLRPMELDVAELARAALEDLRAIQGGEHTLALRLHVTPEDAELRWRVDPEAFRRILVNLVRNAMQAVTEAAGERPHTPDEGVDVRIRPREGWLELSIEDPGPGIPDDVLPNVLETFFTTRRSGSGLGLAVVRRLVEQHGGTVTLTSAPSKGTRAVVRFPP